MLKNLDFTKSADHDNIGRIYSPGDGAAVLGITCAAVCQNRRDIMKYRDVINISIQQIAIFLKCCEYLNYSRVAEEYAFTPSMISKTIKGLEDVLGIQLFIRKYHKLELTLARRELQAGWKNICDAYLDAIARACDIQEEGVSRIRIGILESTRFCADYVTIKLEDKLPDSMFDQIQWERRDMHHLPQALQDDQMDLIITWSGETAYLDAGAVGWRRIFSSPDAVFIPRGHELFERGLRSFADCEPYPFITLSPVNYPHYYKYLEKLCSAYGFTPLLSSICGSTDSARYNLNMGKGIYVAPSLICADWESENIRKYELEGEMQSDLIVAWKKKSLTPVLENMIDIIVS